MLFLSAPELRGIAVGAFLLTAVGVVRSDLGRDAKVTTGLACLSAAAWTLTGSAQASNDVGRPALLLWMTFPAAGFFWAFVSCVFQDRPLRGQDFLPAALLLVLGVFTTVAPESQGLLAVFNAAAAALCLLAMILILRSWPGDLVDSRRSSRVMILALAALFAVAQGTAGTLHWLGRGGEWAAFAVGNDFGSVMISGLALAMGGSCCRHAGHSLQSAPLCLR